MKLRPTKKTKIGLYVHNELIEQIKELAESEGLNFSETLRQLVQRGLDSLNSENEAKNDR